MDNSKISEIRAGQETAFIDKYADSNLAYQPQFVSNDWEQGKKVLSTIEDELMHCDSFAISVAFITEGGITPLLQTFEELEYKKIPGKILTTDYLNFSQPKALKKLNSLQNIEVKMYRTDDGKEGFHTKGYIFKNEEVYQIIVGSSNMTLTALTRNREWNIRLVSTEQGKFAENIIGEFNELWNSDHAQKLDDCIKEYETAYKVSKKQRQIAAEDQVVPIDAYKLKPNSMQIKFIRNLDQLRRDGASKALLISATGTGKTFAAAFAMREQHQKKVLFIVHREQIAKQAMRSFRTVFGSGVSYGLISGNSKDFNCDLIFSTMQMMSKSEIMQKFKPDTFSTIIIDEVHRAGAPSYQRIMDYFKPEFWLGMTASPDRMDGFDIYELFDHNIANEIRLQQAMEDDLLCPFHYFGITDIEIEGDVEKNRDTRDFNRLVSDERVRHILDKAEYFGYSGERIKGLVFCSRRDEGRELAAKFTEKGYPSEFLCGDDSQEKREDCISRLTGEKNENSLSYIFTVDIFNEGVDIPEINQVIMLRPTQSPIIFIQQLGRGLRKADGKEFVVILDFIGNYNNNYMIPTALSGDSSYNKDNMRRYVASGTRMIPGSSSIHFDEIARKRIYNSIDIAKTNDTKMLKEAYQNLKYKLGRIPGITDFEEHGSVDVLKFFDKFGSYHAFLKRYESDYDISFSSSEEAILEYVSRKLVSGKRPDELIILQEIMESKPDILKYYRDALLRVKGEEPTKRETRSAFNYLANTFWKTADKKRFKDCVFLEKDGENYDVSADLKKMLLNNDFRFELEGLVDFGLARYERYYSDTYKDTSFVLYRKYTYEDVCRLLNWKENENALNIGGYKYEKETATLPVFINYEKPTDAIPYEDRFISPKNLIAFSKHPRSINSPDADHIYKRTEADANNRIFLFVRKNKDDKETKEFYFLGEVNAVGEPKPVTMKKTADSAFEINYELEVPVREDLYEYIVNS